MIELYHNDMSVCAQKARFALAEKKLKWEGHHLNLRAADQQKPEYLKLNPNAVVPTLLDNGAVIIESTVICEYLDDAYPEPRGPATRSGGHACAFGLNNSTKASMPPPASSATPSPSVIKNSPSVWKSWKSFTRRCRIP